MDGGKDRWERKGTELIASMNIHQTLLFSSVIIPDSAEIPGHRRQAYPATIYLWPTLESVKLGWTLGLSAVIL